MSFTLPQWTPQGFKWLTPKQILQANSALITKPSNEVLMTAGIGALGAGAVASGLLSFATLAKTAPFIASGLLAGGLRGTGATIANTYLAGATGGGGEVGATANQGAYIKGGAESSPSNAPSHSKHKRRKKYAHSFRTHHKTKRKHKK